jgi:hypothetical protein
MLLYPVVALGIFMTVFITVSLRALFKPNAEIERLSRLPLSEDD